MIFAHGNKSIVVICVFLLIVISSLCTHKLNEVKTELRKSMCEYEVVISQLKEKNRDIVRNLGL